MFCRLVLLMFLFFTAYLVFGEDKTAATEEDVAQECVTKNIDCSFIQPVTFDGFEAAVAAGKTPKQLCESLHEGAKCVRNLLEGECSIYIQDKDKIQAAREAPIIDHICDDQTIAQVEVEENWNCLRASLTEANLNSCSEAEDPSSCDVTNFVNCLTDEFSENCPEDVKETFKKLYTALALTKRTDCPQE